MKRPLDIDLSYFNSIFQAQDAPRPPQDSPRTSPRRPKMSPRTRKIDQKSTREAPQSRLEGVWKAFRKPPVAQKRPRAAQNLSRLRF